MNRILPVLVPIAMLLAAAPAVAQEKLARDSGCLACHAVDKKIVGPAYKEVADKYRGDAKAEDNLVQKVLKGTSGVWGDVPMPPNPVSEGDARTLVKWILSLK